MNRKRAILTGIVLVSLAVIFFIFFYNRNKLYDNPDIAAKEYCKCLKDNNIDKKFRDAAFICRGKFLEKDKYYRIYIMHLYYPKASAKERTQAEIDSARNYMNIFYNTLGKQCNYKDLFSSEWEMDSANMYRY